jgi:uncharacterized membrane protein
MADKNGDIRIIFNHFSFSEMLELSLVPINVYSKRDYTMLIGLLNCLHNLTMADCVNDNRALLTSYADSILSDAQEHLDNALEKEAINKTIKKLNASGYYDLSLLY